MQACNFIKTQLLHKVIYKGFCRDLNQLSLFVFQEHFFAERLLVCACGVINLESKNHVPQLF